MQTRILRRAWRRHPSENSIAMHSVPLNCKISLAKRSGAIKFSCGFLSAKALFFCREGAGVRVVCGGGEKSLGLSSGSKSVGGVGGSMGPSGSRRGGFVDIGSKAHCCRRVLLRDTCRTPPSSDGKHPLVRHKARRLCHLCSSTPRPGLAEDRPLGSSRILLPKHGVSTCGGPPRPTQLRVRRTAAEMWTVRRARRHKRESFLWNAHEMREQTESKKRYDGDVSLICPLASSRL